VKIIHWYKIDGENVELRIYAKPNAKRSEMQGVSERGLCVALKARPQEGEANAELIDFLAIFFQIPKRDLVLRRGETARFKAVVLPYNAKVRAFIEAMVAS
jgi:uncharacterized protein (TIGR00251 family)